MGAMSTDERRTISGMTREVLGGALKGIAKGITGTRKASEEFAAWEPMRQNHSDDGVDLKSRSPRFSVAYESDTMWEMSNNRSASNSSGSRSEALIENDEQDVINSGPLPLGPGMDPEKRLPLLSSRRRDVSFASFDEEPSTANSLDDTILPSMGHHSSFGTLSKVDWQRFALKFVAYVTIFGISSHWLDVVAENEIELTCAKIMSYVGLPGLFALVFVGDAIPQPLSYVPLIYIAIRGNVEGQNVFVVCCGASYSAALMGYAVGGQLRQQFGSRIFFQLCEEYPFVPDLMQRRGPVGFAVVLLLPIPLAIATWTAGSYKVDFPCFMVASTIRAQRITLFIVLSLVSGKQLAWAIFVFSTVTVAALNIAANVV